MNNRITLNHELIYQMIDGESYPVRIIGQDKIVIYMNKNMENAFGNLLGEDGSSIFVEPWRSKYIKTISKDIVRPVDMVAEIGEAHFNILIRPIKLNNKIYYVESYIDITDRLAIEDKLRSNYNKLKNETIFAKSIQKSVLPIDDEYWNMLGLSSIYLPADDLGGDIFDLVKLDDDEALLYIADVAGHGIKASLLTIFLREVVRGKTEEAKEGLDVLLRALLEDFKNLDIDPEMYFSIVLCKYNKRHSELTVANAGHNCFPIICRSNGRVEEIPVKGMPISKISFEESFEEEITGLYSGDRLLLFTDGIIEEYNNKEKKIFGAEGVRDIVSRNYLMNGKELAELIVAEAGKYSTDMNKDDRAIMVADILP